MSGIDVDGGQIRKGAVDAVIQWVRSRGGVVPAELQREGETIARAGGTPLAVADERRVLGLVHLKDIVKGGIKERFAELRRMGIRTVMITGDNALTAAAIAAESGVDDFLAQATPEKKLELIRAQQAEGRLVAMCGDGTNDAPALAQSDVGVAMNTGTMAAREAGNMVDLDSDPTKLIEIVAIGKQLLMTRGALTTFSIANDVAKYFAIIPAIALAFYPQLGALNIMGLATPQSAILSAIIFNALVIVFLSGDLRVDLVRRIVTVAGAEVKLSPKEYDILRLLVVHAGKVLTHPYLLQEVWGPHADVQYLRIYVRQLRRKLEAEPERPAHILTETGVGYRLIDQDR